MEKTLHNKSHVMKSLFKNQFTFIYILAAPPRRSQCGLSLHLLSLTLTHTRPCHDHLLEGVTCSLLSRPLLTLPQGHNLALSSLSAHRTSPHLTCPHATLFSPYSAHVLLCHLVPLELFFLSRLFFLPSVWPLAGGGITANRQHS